MIRCSELNTCDVKLSMVGIDLFVIIVYFCRSVLLQGIYHNKYEIENLVISIKLSTLTELSK